MDTRALASDSYALSDWSAPDLIPLVEVEYRDDMWWTIPQTTSAYLYQQFMLREKQTTSGTGATRVLAPGAPALKSQR